MVPDDTELVPYSKQVKGQVVVHEVMIVIHSEMFRAIPVVVVI